MPSLTDPWSLGGVPIENRVVLAPLAGIGNWFVRLQAKRFGAGLVVSEMVSSFGLAHGNERTVREFLRIHPDEHPLSMQLFGHDPAVMAEAAAMVADAGAELIDLNMGCPVRKVCRTGAGAALLSDPAKAVALAQAARAGSGLPVTVKLRPGEQRPVISRRRARPATRRGGGRGGNRVPSAARLAAALGAARLRARARARGDPARAGDPLRGALVRRSRSQRLRRERRDGDHARARLARKSLAARPPDGTYEGEPTPAEVARELAWVIECAEEHLGAERAGRYLRKFYPWYAERLGLTRKAREPLVTPPTTAHAREAWSEIAGSATPLAA